MPPQMSPEFASLQLTLVDRFVELGLGSYTAGVNQLTNLQRRLGLGTPTDPASDPQWVDLVERIASHHSHDERVDAVTREFESLPPAVPEHIAHAWPTVGSFSIQVAGPVARTHFFSTDTDDLSPLHPTKREQRRHELRAVLSTVRTAHPELSHVAGASWMYATNSYRCLFPDAHVRSAKPRRNSWTFRGMSHWGQFLDHRWAVRTDLATEFRQQVRTWEGGDPCRLFPIDTLEVFSPIDVFDLG